MSTAMEGEAWTYTRPNKLNVFKHVDILHRHGKEAYNQWRRHGSLSDLEAFNSTKKVGLVESAHHIGDMSRAKSADECQWGSESMEEGDTQ